MNAVQREHQNRQQQKNQTGGEVQAQVIRTNHATFAPIEMTQHQNQREQYGERAECHEDGHTRTGRNEGEHVAGVRAKEA